MNTALEFHDSTLASLEVLGRVIILSLIPAIIHRSECRPGLDAGTVHTQPMTLTLHEAALSRSPTTFPVSISGGWLKEDSHHYDNLLPLPASLSAEIVLHLVLTSGETLDIQGKNLTSQTRGEPVFLESFRP